MKGELHDKPNDALVQFALCDNMKWNFLPRGGGIPDQDPDFMDRIRYIFYERNEKIRRDQEAQDAKYNKPSSGGIKQPRGGRTRSPRRR